jgi:hypothetical protein
MVKQGLRQGSAHPALVVLAAVVGQRVAVAHVLRAAAGVERQLVLSRALPQRHRLRQVLLDITMIG